MLQQLWSNRRRKASRKVGVGTWCVVEKVSPGVGHDHCSSLQGRGWERSEPRREVGMSYSICSWTRAQKETKYVLQRVSP